MKRIMLGAVALAAIGAAPALAADLPARVYTKAPPVAAQIYDWTGFYIGINGGFGASNKCWGITNNLGVPVAPAAAEGCSNGFGGVAGGQVGYRWQRSALVFGVEAQGDWARLRGSSSSQFFGGPAVNQSTVTAFGLFTGQVGYAVNNILMYVKGGAAVTADKYAGLVAPASAAFDQASETRWGGALGVGFEYGMTPNWTVAVEYDHLFMGTASNNFSSTGLNAPVGAFSRTDSIGQNVDMLTARVNYRFGGPVIAKY